MNAQRELRRQKWCPDCDRRVLAVELAPNYQIHALLCFLTCGLYIPVALVLLAAGSLTPKYACPKCGATCR